MLRFFRIEKSRACRWYCGSRMFLAPSNKSLLAKAPAEPLAKGFGSHAGPPTALIICPQWGEPRIASSHELRSPPQDFRMH
jgi:hypothetical protein